MKEFTEEQKIIRKKSKRIERAMQKVYELRYDIMHSEIDYDTKTWIDEDLKELLLYLQNNDKEENKYNQDNYNG